MRKSSFVDLLKRKGYEIESRKLGGGFVNDVNLITAKKDGNIIKYVLKKYGSEEEMESMLRGYDSISRVAKTPTIVYQDREQREVAYDMIEGRSIKEMIERGDKDAPRAIIKLAEELEKLHRSKQYDPYYERNDSPDEFKIRKHAIKAYENKKLAREEVNEIQRRIREYIPHNKGFIHGDAHLGNFLYSEGQVYVIDPDNAKISDLNADLGKIIHSIRALEDSGKITSAQSSELRELFLDKYDGEDPRGVDLLELRTPLIQLKSNSSSAVKIRRMLSLEGRLAPVAVIVGLLALFVILSNFNMTGSVITDLGGKALYKSILGIIILVLIVILIIKYFRKN